MTKRETAAGLGITESYYGRIESGERQKHIDSDLIYKLSKLFEVTINEIYENEYENGKEGA